MKYTIRVYNLIDREFIVILTIYLACPFEKIRVKQLAGLDVFYVYSTIKKHLQSFSNRKSIIYSFDMCDVPEQTLHAF
nr:MAG TPA: hypothetical protein [Caudoviricetes sp.]